LEVPETGPEEPEEGPEQTGTGISSSVVTVTILRLDLPIEAGAVRCTAQDGEIGVVNDNTLASDAILVAGSQTQILVVVVASSQRSREIAMLSTQIPNLNR
jgi:hypothetical protein